MLLPLILPGIITGLSLLMLFRAADMKLSLLTIILGHGTALISVATTEVFAGLQKLDRAQEEASLDLGANYWQTFWRVTLPNLRLSIIGAALLIFTLSMDEIAVSFFLIGRDNTLPLEIWGRLRRGITPEINAISTIIFIFSLVAIVTWYRLRAKAKRTWCCSARVAHRRSGCGETGWVFRIPPFREKPRPVSPKYGETRTGTLILRTSPIPIAEPSSGRETTSLRNPEYIVKW